MPSSRQRVRKNRPSDDCLWGHKGHSKNCQTNPSSETILPSPQTYLATPSFRRAASSPPRGAPRTVSCKCRGASPWISAGMTPSCSCSLRGACGLLVPREVSGASCFPAGSGRRGRRSAGTGTASVAGEACRQPRATSSQSLAVPALR